MTPAPFVWTVTWGRPGRSDWKAVLVVASDPDEAVAVAVEARPEWLRPTEVFLASDAVTKAVLDPDGADIPVTLPVVRS